ncbi:MAG: DUF4115 domain-containing protein [Armatimonadota bacterium]|nr:DUF4115 domain-containing protein [Armatimonadota bacterium]
MAVVATTDGVSRAVELVVRHAGTRPRPRSPKVRKDDLRPEGKAEDVGNIERVVQPVRSDRPRPDIGAALRQARVERGLSLTELQARTKVRARYLAALEEGRFQDLPPYPFARGFLQTAAEELGLDPGPLVAQLSVTMGSSAEPSVESWKRLDGAVRPAVPPSRARRIAMTAAVIGIAAIGALAVIFAQQLRQFSEPAPSPTPEAAPTGTQAAATGPQDAPVAGPQAPVTPAEALTPAPAPEATPGAADAVAAAGGVTVALEATGRSWLLVVVDETAVFEGFVAAGDSRRWTGKTTIRVRAGNAGAVTLVANGTVLKPLGLAGEVVDRTFSSSGSR